MKVTKIVYVSLNLSAPLANPKLDHILAEENTGEKQMFMSRYCMRLLPLNGFKISHYII